MFRVCSKMQGPEFVYEITGYVPKYIIFVIVNMSETFVWSEISNIVLFSLLYIYMPITLFCSIYFTFFFHFTDCQYCLFHLFCFYLLWLSSVSYLHYYHLEIFDEKEPCFTWVINSIEFIVDIDLIIESKTFSKDVLVLVLISNWYQLNIIRYWYNIKIVISF